MSAPSPLPDSKSSSLSAPRTGWLRVAVFWLSAFLVGALSITPVENLPPQSLDVWDKAQHAFGFLGLTVMGLMAHPRHTAKVLLGLLLYGIGIELVQSATGWRHGDAADWLADAIGVGAGAVSLRLWRLWAGKAK